MSGYHRATARGLVLLLLDISCLSSVFPEIPVLAGPSVVWSSLIAGPGGASQLSVKLQYSHSQAGGLRVSHCLTGSWCNTDNARPGQTCISLQPNTPILQLSQRVKAQTRPSVSLVSVLTKKSEISSSAALIYVTLENIEKHLFQ